MIRCGAALVLVLASVLVGPLTAQGTRSVSLGAAESLLTAGNAVAARQTAQRHTDRHRADPQGWILLGRSILATHPTSNLPRVQAINAFREATRLAPRDTAAWHWLARAGFELGSVDGELVAREGLERLLTLEPRAEDAWREWRMLVPTRSQRERMRARLQPAAAEPVVAARIARLFIEEERHSQADSVLDQLLMADLANGTALALRAQSAFEAGDTVTGAALYTRALAGGPAGTELLWEQAIGIASPGEIVYWDSLPPGRRPAFLRAFWASRDPDLFASANARIAEHFRRLRVARREWPLRFPLAAYQIKADGRALNTAPSTAEEVYFQRCEARQFVGGSRRIEDRVRDPFNYGGGAYYAPGILIHIGSADQPAIFMSPFHDIRNVDSVAAAIGYSLRTGLDDRGLTYLRYGAPSSLHIGPLNGEDPFCAIPDLELWSYPSIGTVRFFRPTAVRIIGAGTFGSDRPTGDVVFRPMRDDQFEAMAAAMTTDETAVPAPLSFGTWTAQFATTGGTELLVVTSQGEAAAALVGPAEDSVARGTSATGIVSLRARPGTYSLLSQVRDSGQLGRMSLAVRLRSFGVPSQSDLLAAPRWEGVPTREAMLARVRRDLVFRVGEVLRTYAELYGVEPDSSGRVRYQATYEVAEADADGQVARRDTIRALARFSFERDHAAALGPIREWLDITPATLPRGRYLLRLETRDLATGRRIGRSQLGFVVR